MIALREVTEGDLPTLFEHQREPAANRLARVPARDRDAFLAHWRLTVLGSPDVVARAIELDGELAGYVVSWARDGKRLVGYWIGSAFAGRGVATAALAALVAEHELTRPLHAHVAVTNLGSIRVLEKNGFRRMGDPLAGPDGVEELLMELARLPDGSCPVLVARRGPGRCGEHELQGEVRAASRACLGRSARRCPVRPIRQRTRTLPGARVAAIRQGSSALAEPATSVATA